MLDMCFEEPCVCLCGTEQRVKVVVLLTGCFEEVLLWFRVESKSGDKNHVNQAS